MIVSGKDAENGVCVRVHEVIENKNNKIELTVKMSEISQNFVRTRANLAPDAEGGHRLKALG